MATIVVEDGTGVAGANSYVDESELTTYAADRGITLTGSTGVLLIQSMDYIESRNYQGSKATATQPLQFPRAGVYVDGFEVAKDEIPDALKQGQLATAVAIDQGNDPLGTIDRKVTREKVDVIEVEYAESASATPINRTINAALSKLLASGGGGANFKVSRA